MTEPRSEPPWAELDAGIRETVHTLWLAGFEPCDSGDGSKVGEMACAIAVPHVFLQCQPEQMVAEAARLEAVALELGIDLAGGEHGAAVQVTWSPGDERATLMLFGRLP